MNSIVRIEWKGNRMYERVSDRVVQVPQYENPASYVIIAVAHKVASAIEENDLDRANDLVSIAKALEAEFPEAKAELDRRYPTLSNGKEKGLFPGEFEG